MKTIININNTLSCLLLVTAGLSQGFSQNLVANAGMDAKCIKNGYGQIDKTETWSNANGGTVDIFDKEKSRTYPYQNGIPHNYMGYQPLAQIGQNYAGIIAYYDDGANNREDSALVQKLGIKDGYKKYTEYLQGSFNEPLVAGKVYQVSFKVSLADKSGRAVSCLGALITNEKVDQKSNTFLTQEPQFISHRVIADTANWVTLYGAYIANGGEKYITIGCFKDENNFTVQNVVAPNENDSRKAYYYVSDVAIAPYIAKPNMESIVLGVDYVELMDLRFDLASAEIDSRFYNELDEVATWMAKHPEMKFFIAGYTDKTGTDAINDPLSVNRAKAVKKYLANKGVKDSNLIVEGFGSDNPVDDRIKSRRNRRVEIYLYSVNTLTTR
ncbi:MAG: OmpA family lipoprotein [Bacteroidetes bacterium]|jgi:outer membrane protein OmpA-like peptidoglycan-associated protein|nr:OmpA family lipoprotein [Bacteroidota bacterium]